MKVLTWLGKICVHPGDRSQEPAGEISAFSQFQRILCQIGTRAELLQLGGGTSVYHQVAILTQSLGPEGAAVVENRVAGRGQPAATWQEQTAAGPAKEEEETWRGRGSQSGYWESGQAERPGARALSQ